VYLLRLDVVVAADGPPGTPGGFAGGGGVRVRSNSVVHSHRLSHRGTRAARLP
jgi:hypothetical protein